MKQKPYGRRAFQAAVANLIRRSDVPLDRIWQAFRSLPAQDQDTMPHIVRLLRLEG